MKASVQWLKDYVTIGIPVDKLAYKLTMSGLEVEKIETVKDDSVFEMEITPNRPDCLNMLGIARETAAILNKALKPPKVRKISFPRTKCDVSVLDREGCPRYIGTLIEDVSVEDSPEWIKKRISPIGLRPVNNIVDITNFCLMETGQPMHAFDYDKLVGGRIIVRRARKGEKIVTIDGIERALDPSIVVIADAKRPVAIAGVMGGKETEVSRRTKNVLLESAYFNPVLIRQTAKKIGLTSDSSYRFERGVDMQMVEDGANRALSLICKFAGGKITQRSDVFPTRRRIKKKEINVNVEKIVSLLGTEITPARCKIILKKLGFKVKVEAGNVLKVYSQPFREDVSRDVDVVEEIARVIGYDNLPSSLPIVKASNIPEDSLRKTKKQARATLASQGLSEVITYTLINRRDLEKTKQGNLKGVQVKNPLTQDQELMRPSGLPGLLSVLSSNLNRGQKDVHLFEIGKNYSNAGEEEVITILMTGSKGYDWRNSKDTSLADYYDLKGVVCGLCSKLNISNMKISAHDYDIFSEGEGGAIKLSNKEIGYIGRVNDEILKNWEIKQKNIFFAKINIIDLHDKMKQIVKYRPISGYPSISRDVSLAVNNDVTFEQIKDVASQFGKELLSGVNLVEQYLGDKIPEGQKGIVLSLSYQSLSRTLTEEEINKIHQQNCRALEDKLGAIIR